MQGDTSLTAAAPVPLDTVTVAAMRNATGLVPRPARDYFDEGRWAWPAWWWLALAAAAVLLLTLIVRWRRGRRRRGRMAADPYAVAQQDFVRVQRAAWLDAGEYGRYVALHVDIVRAYLEGRVPRMTLALTTDELLAAARNEPRVPVQKLQELLTTSDAVKFAEAEVTMERAQAVGRQARALVDEIERASARG